MAAEVNLYGYAEAFLSAIGTLMADAGVTMPAISYVAPGGVLIDDGEMFVCMMSNLYPGRPGNSSVQTDPAETTHFAEFQLVLIRPTPTMDERGNAPSPDAMSASAQQQLEDMLQMLYALEQARAQFLVVDHNMPYAIVGVRPYGPEGATVGTIGTVQISFMD